MDGNDYALLLLPVGLAVLGILAIRFGVDSRASWSDSVPASLATEGPGRRGLRSERAAPVRSVHSGAPRIASRVPASATSEEYACPPERTSAAGSRANDWARAWTWAASRSAE